MDELSVDEAIHIMQDWSFDLFGGSDEEGFALSGFPYAGPLRVYTGQPPTPVLVLGRAFTQPHSPNRLAPLPPCGLWSDVDEGFSAIPLEGASPLANMERVARATPSPHVRGRVVALAHFLAAFKEAFLMPGQSRGDIVASFRRVQHLLQALLFDWHPYQHGEDALALSRFIRARTSYA